MPDIVDIEERLRTAEEELIEHRSDFKNLVENVDRIRKSIESVTQYSSQLDQLHRIEAAATAAHKRIDVIEKGSMKLGFEHEHCMRTQPENALILKTMQTDLTALKNSVSLLTKADDETKGFWKGRITALVDKFLPVVLVILGFIFYSHYNPKVTSYTEMEKQQLEIMKELKQGIQSLKETTPRRSDNPSTLDLQPTSP